MTSWKDNTSCILLSFSQISWKQKLRNKILYSIGYSNNSRKKCIENILQSSISSVAQDSSLYKIMVGKMVGHYIITSTEICKQFSRIHAYLTDNSLTSAYESPYS